jgi:DNA-binding NarL/FixJ family response regulator
MTIINILLADDHGMMRDGLQAVLELQPDLRVVAAVADGNEAVEAARKFKPQIAVLDIGMPGLNGIDAAKRIGEVSPDTRILMLSMHSSSEYVYRALQAGTRAYLLKESAGSRLVEAVRAVHAGRRYLDDRIKETVIAGYLSDERHASPLESLSARERSVLHLIVQGRSNGEMAQLLCLSVKTVETYRSRLMHKLGVDGVVGLVKFALAHGLAAPIAATA